MKTAFVLLAVFAGVALAARPQPTAELKLASEVELLITDEIRAEFLAWKAEHGKTYASNDEHNKRLSVYAANKVIVEEHNAKKLSYTLGMNHLADLTKEEFAAQYLGGYKHHGLDAKQRVDEKTWRYADVTPDADVDWRKHGAVTPVKNQGQCGSCWAFSTTGSVEGIHAITSGKIVSLSEQQLVSCDHNGDMGCSGGLMDHAFEWIQQNGGIVAEDTYPYTSGTGMTGQCDQSKTTPVAATIDGYEDVPTHSESALASAVTKQPISIAIEADHSSFQLYSGGVYTANDCGTNLDHGVLLVGYGQDSSGPEYWIVKNSWGKSWGESGYIRMEKGNHGTAGQCGLTLAASYPTIKA